MKPRTLLAQLDKIITPKDAYQEKLSWQYDEKKEEFFATKKNCSKMIRDSLITRIGKLLDPDNELELKTSPVQFKNLTTHTHPNNKDKDYFNVRIFIKKADLEKMPAIKKALEPSPGCSFSFSRLFSNCCPKGTSSRQSYQESQGIAYTELTSPTDKKKPATRSARKA
jgi:hypothetical protein